MSKNLTRKGLAFGALVALGSSVIAGAPASAVGIANDYVSLTDTQAFGNYNMLTTGYIELESNFSQGANSGAYLSYFVEDANAISVFDTVQQGSNVDTVATPNLAAYAEINGATDKVQLSFAAASGIEVGDAIDGDANLAITGATSSVITTLKSPARVSAVKEVATTSMATTADAVTLSATADTAVLTTTSAHGLAVGDVVLLASTGFDNSSVAGGNTEADITGALNAYHVVTAVDTTTTFTVKLADGAIDAADTVTLDGGSFAVHQVSVNLATTSAVTADTEAIQGGNITTTGTAEVISELTDADALDSVANIRTAAFGAAGVIGSAGTAVARATDNSYVVDTRSATPANGAKVIRFASSSDTTGGSIKVTAFVDNDADGVIDSTEYVSTTRTITFVKPADVAYTIGQTGVYISSSSVTGTVSADLNLDEVGTQGLLELSTDHNDAGTVVAETDQTLTFNSTTKVLNGTEALTSALAAGDAIRFAIESANVEVGSPASFGVGSLVVAGSSVYVAASVNNTEASVKDANGSAASEASVAVRTKTASVVATYTAFNDDATDADNAADTVADKVVPGVPYTATVTSSAVDSTDGVKVNATVVDGGTETFTGVTDASGQVVLTLTQTAADAADWVNVSLDVQGLSVSGLVKFTYADADYDVYNVAGNLTSSTDYNKSVVIGGTLAQTYLVADQFGVAPANGATVITATRSGSRTTTAATWGYQVPVVDGKATVSIVDNGVGTGSDTVTIKALEITTGGALSTEHDSNTYTLSYVATAADYTPTGVTAVLSHDGVDDDATNDLPVAVSAKTLGNFDSRATKGANAPVLETYNVDATSPFTAVDAQLTLSGTVSNATGGVVVGAPVTISAKGLLFVFTTADSKTVYGMDTITVNTTSAGTYSVNVYGDRGGKQTITVTAAAATKTADVTFAVGTPSALALTAPANAQAGRAVDVVATITDKYGVGSKGTTVAFTTAGPGYLNSASGTTDADGKVTLKLILGVAEVGSTVITAKATIAGVEVSKAATVVIAAPVVEAPVVTPVVAGVSGGTGKFNVAVTNAAGKNVVVKVAGKFFRSFAGSADKKTVALKAPKGSHKVTVYVGGKLVANKTVSVK